MLRKSNVTLHDEEAFNRAVRNTASKSFAVVNAALFECEDCVFHACVL